MPALFRFRPAASKPRFLRVIHRSIVLLSLLSLAGLLLLKLESIASQIKTVAGHNLDPTPWHLFPPKTFEDQSTLGRASQIIKCSYLTCPATARSHPIRAARGKDDQGQGSNQNQCPDFFRWIYRDLEPWAGSRISASHLMKAKDFAAFRVVIVDGRLYTEFYYACVQSRAMFTIWGLLQFLRRYPGLVPDVDLMFDCMDKPTITRSEHQGMPLPLFRYCTTPEHFDIPFPDWSYWGWPEVNIKPWDRQFKEIKKGSQAVSWTDKLPHAYWKGNPDVASPVRTELLNCNDTEMWGAQILRQNWVEEAKAGYEQSRLSNQCKHRYKIYAEGYAWSVSLKYILSCGSTTLIISPQYEDFLSRGLMPKVDFWPIPHTQFCPAIKFAVDWGNQNPAQAEEIGHRAEDFMERLSMDRVYDYMFHLLSEYAKLQEFKPVPPPSALEVCEESLLCFADQVQRKFLKRSTASPSPNPPFAMPPPDNNLMNSWINQKTRNIMEVESMRSGQFPH
uniref:Glycosyl transferase CAP10 domain-containing protein n=1 Tax=Kalanchoe fedtschenkoi TaxID=63787 RepID=A0A7N0TGE0_KALFE